MKQNRRVWKLNHIFVFKDENFRPYSGADPSAVSFSSLMLGEEIHVPLLPLASFMNSATAALS